MATPEVRETIHLPEGVTASVAGDGKVVFKGKNATLERTFKHPAVTITVDGKDVVVHMLLARKQTRALAGTWVSHLKNMVAGATKDYEYTMKAVYSHFPIKAKAQGEWLIIENFLGEKTARKARILKGVKVNVKGEEISVTGPNVESVSQTAANIEQACRIRGFDSRVFQDGIYITSKGA